MGNILKTIRYFKRNGIKDTVYAIAERLLPQRGVPFDEEETVSGAALKGSPYLFSIVVPVYETDETFLRKMIESCLMQTYGNFELVIADASKSEKPGKVIASYTDARIRYIKLSQNYGIAENSNRALDEARGDYCVLLDHDDMLSLDALYTMAAKIAESEEKGVKPLFLYSDEDKCNGDGTKFFMPHFKEKFNLDLLLSNNYICHLTAINAEIIRKIRFREGFDGAQDHDLFLRTAGEILYSDGRYQPEKEASVIHVKRVLYHWRSHEASTSSNPASKEYAYEAGRKAVADFAEKHFGKCEVSGSKHLGFYDIKYTGDIFSSRPEVGAIGGMAVRRKRVVTGILDRDGKDMYAGMNSRFSGYMHKADLKQRVFSLDIRTSELSGNAPESCRLIKKEFEEKAKTVSTKAEADKLAFEYSMKLGKALEEAGKIFLYFPERNGEV